jgi:hypothetical protein
MIVCVYVGVFGYEASKQEETHSTQGWNRQTITGIKRWQGLACNSRRNMLRLLERNAINIDFQTHDFTSYLLRSLRDP